MEFDLNDDMDLKEFLERLFDLMEKIDSQQNEIIEKLDNLSREGSDWEVQ